MEIKLPKQTEEAFIKFAEDNFDSDTGMAVKWLFDFQVTYGQTIEALIQRIEEIESKLDLFEGNATIKVETTNAQMSEKDKILERMKKRKERIGGI